MDKKTALKIRAVLDTVTAQMTDAEALANPGLCARWKHNKAYKTGEKVSYNGLIYAVLVDHEATKEAAPNVNPAQYKCINIAAETATVDKTKVKAYNAKKTYMTGDMVKYKGNYWRCMVDNTTDNPTNAPDNWVQF